MLMRAIRVTLRCHAFASKMRRYALSPLRLRYFDAAFAPLIARALLLPMFRHAFKARLIRAAADIFAADADSAACCCFSMPRYDY